jgi:hypothetical protein
MIRSASTWSYNVVLQILRAHNRTVVGAHCATLEEAVAELGESDLVFKSHDLDRLSIQLLSLGKAKAIYTHRDPLDAIVSGMSIFNISFEEMYNYMAVSIKTLESLLRLEAGLMISYEEIMTDGCGVVSRIAEYLEQPLTTSAALEIADRTSRDRMKEVSDNFDAIPRERICQAPANWAYDKETFLHRNHIQDSRNGKGWEQLRHEERSLVISTFGSLLERVRPSVLYPVNPSQSRYEVVEDVTEAGTSRLSENLG